MSTAQLAAELLDLESLHQQGGLTAAQDQRWGHLVIELLQTLRVGERNRKNLRIPASGGALIQRGRVHYRCTLDNVSHFGVGVRGALTRLSVGDEVTISSIEADDATQPIGLTAEVAWIDQEKARVRCVGLHIVDLDPIVRAAFFSHVYYPHYLAHLRRLAAPERS